jgi:hypothetical protein
VGPRAGESEPELLAVLRIERDERFVVERLERRVNGAEVGPGEDSNASESGAVAIAASSSFTTSCSLIDFASST